MVGDIPYHMGSAVATADQTEANMAACLAVKDRRVYFHFNPLTCLFKKSEGDSRGY